MAEKTVHFALVLHAHQPTGNFDHVFRESFERCYAPFLEELARHADLPVTLHYSGILLEWLEANEPDHIGLLRGLVAEGRVEILGGGFGEPILVMLSDRDRAGQMRAMSEQTERLFGVRPRGAWLAERVWEQALAHDIAGAGLAYAIVDDSHLRLAGLRGAQLLGSYVTEDRGATIRLFPSSEALRYHIPFRAVGETIDLFRSRATAGGERLLVYGDDMEKFGGWPGTHEHVFGGGWLRDFFLALEENRSWIRLRKLSEALEIPPLGKVYVPDASYREMTEWALPTEAREEYEALRRDLGEEMARRASPFFRGGNWRGFLSKYPEAGEMYGRMMEASWRVAASGGAGAKKKQAEWELYRGQTNCAYWHGVFGGLYLPHLRSAIYRKLIRAEKLAAFRPGDGEAVGAEERDFDFDGSPEIRLTSTKLSLFLHPRRGGHLYELDDREKEVNLLAGMSRRREAYHEGVRRAAGAGDEDVASIHDRTVAKQEGLDRLLVYDSHRRESLVDHFFPRGTTLDDLVSSAPVEAGDFVSGRYDGRIEREGAAAVVRLAREGTVRAEEGAIPVRVEKRVRLAPDDRSFEAAYRIANGGKKRLEALFSVEFALALLAGNAPDRYVVREGENTGSLASRLDLAPCRDVGARDEWLRIAAGIIMEGEAPVWIFPIETVSLSEGGYESVYQCTLFLPRWEISLPPGGEWSVTIRHYVVPIEEGGSGNDGEGEEEGDA